MNIFFCTSTHTIFKAIGICFLLTITTISCNNKKRTLLPTTYQEGIVLATIDEALQIDLIADSIGMLLETPLKGLPRPENILDYDLMPEKSFKNHFLSYTNILQIKKHPSKNKITIAKDKWANHQNILTINATHKDSALSLIQTQKETINHFFHSKEIEKGIERHLSFGDSISSKSLSNYTGVKLALLSEGFIAEKDSAFFWYRREQEKKRGSLTHQISQGIIVCKLPYKDTLQVNPTFIEATIQRVLQERIKGPTEGSFMSISNRFILPNHTVQKTNGVYHTQTRGLWRIENGLNMGGPFINHTIVSEATGEIIYLLGNVYAPELKKKALLNELEASIKSYYILQ